MSGKLPLAMRGRLPTQVRRESRGRFTGGRHHVSGGGNATTRAATSKRVINVTRMED